jgi:plastocyanin
MKPIKVAGLLAATVVATTLLTFAVMRPTASHAQHTPATMPAAQETMVIAPGMHLGPDKKMHDSFTPTGISAQAGQKIILTVYNYDTGPHSITAPALKLNLVIPGAKTTGIPNVVTFSFTVKAPGTYHWFCALPCDDDAKGWAMVHNDYMAGLITISRS